MAKLFFLLLSALSLLLTTSVDGRSILTGEEERCAERIRGLQLESCERFVGDRPEPKHLMLERPAHVDRRGDMEKCCRQLSELDSGCRSEALRYVARSLEERWEMEGEELERLRRRTASLDSRCGGERRDGEDDCRESIRREDLGECREYVSRGGRSSRRGECCKQLRRLDEECREGAIREMVEEQKREKMGDEAKKVESRGEQLRERCCRMSV